MKISIDCEVKRVNFLAVRTIGKSEEPYNSGHTSNGCLLMIVRGCNLFLIYAILALDTEDLQCLRQSLALTFSLGSRATHLPVADDCLDDCSTS